jgi:lysophospholipase L1-like esterase
MRGIKSREIAVIFVAASLSLMACAQDKPVLGHWVSAWGTAPHGALLFGIPTPTYENQTLRMIVRPTIGGKRLRIRFSNEFGASALKIGAAHVALLEQGSKIVPDTDRVLTFGGQKTIAIPRGAPALSDPVDLNVPAFAEVAVSIFLPEKTIPATWHFFALHETYIGGPGDLTGQTETPNATVSDSWPWLSGVELWAAKDTAAIVALGDSITDGHGSKIGEYHDWPDELAKRLAGAEAVVNEGIGGNKILHDGMGVNALARFDRDVLSQPGVTDLILLEGANDFVWPHWTVPKGLDFPDYSAEDVTSSDLIAGMREMIDRAHEHGIRIFGATITPLEGGILPGGVHVYSEKGEATRQAVNQWIRTGGAFDGVIDFDAAVRDPAHPTRLRQDYQSGDYVHPNDAGYKAMADAIDLSLLHNSRQQ